jgi:hypothetical protein
MLNTMLSLLYAEFAFLQQQKNMGQKPQKVRE